MVASSFCHDRKSALTLSYKESLLINEPSSSINGVVDSTKLSSIESAVSCRCSHLYSAVFILLIVLIYDNCCHSIEIALMVMTNNVIDSSKNE